MAIHRAGLHWRESGRATRPRRSRGRPHCATARRHGAHAGVDVFVRTRVRRRWRGTVGSPGAAASLHDHQSMRLDLAETGWYALTVGEASAPKPGPTDRGPYRFTVERFGTSPERVPSGLAPGDSITGEAIDGP